MQAIRSTNPNFDPENSIYDRDSDENFEIEGDDDDEDEDEVSYVNSQQSNYERPDR